MAGFDFDRLTRVFGTNVVHDEAKASATVTHSFGNEDFLRGHFPDFPVVPGVILLDGMMLAAARLFERLTGRACGVVQQIGVGSVTFHRPVLPGAAASFVARADSAQQDAHGFACKCSVMIEGTRHARATIIFRTDGERPSPAT